MNAHSMTVSRLHREISSLSMVVVSPLAARTPLSYHQLAAAEQNHAMELDLQHFLVSTIRDCVASIAFGRQEVDHEK